MAPNRGAVGGSHLLPGDGWLVGWLVGRLVGWLVGSLVRWFVGSLVATRGFWMVEPVLKKIISNNFPPSPPKTGFYLTDFLGIAFLN